MLRTLLLLVSIALSSLFAVPPVTSVLPIPAAAQAQDPQASSAARTILLEDDFGDPDAGWLPRSIPNPNQWTRGYDDGEYFLEKVDAEYTPVVVSVIPGSSPNTSLAVEARLVGATEGRYIALACRRSADGQYRATIDPDRGRAWLARWQSGQETLLTDRTPSPVIARGNETNHIELTCAGNSISLSINGVEVASARDESFPTGEMSLGTGTFTESPNTVEARFDNLAVYEVAARPAEPRVVLSDNFDDPANGWLPSNSGLSEYTVEYAGGEYVLRLVDLAYQSIPSAFLPGSYRDTSLAVDARIVGDSNGRYIVLTCRSSATGQYRLSVFPATRYVGLSRYDGGDNWTVLAEQPTESIRRDNATNRIELSCVGNTISASINGTVAASAQDSAHREGRMWIGADATGMGRPVEARFDNLVLTQR